MTVDSHFVSLQSTESEVDVTVMWLLKSLIDKEGSPFRVFLKLCTQNLLNTFFVKCHSSKNHRQKLAFASETSLFYTDEFRLQPNNEQIENIIMFLSLCCWRSLTWFPVFSSFMRSGMTPEKLQFVRNECSYKQIPMKHHESIFIIKISYVGRLDGPFYMI